MSDEVSRALPGRAAARTALPFFLLLSAAAVSVAGGAQTRHRPKQKPENEWRILGRQVV
jgi:hypothetical protein